MFRPAWDAIRTRVTDTDAQLALRALTDAELEDIGLSRDQISALEKTIEGAATSKCCERGI